MSSLTIPIPRAVKGVFSSVASSYDVMNDAMSLGIHRLWKDHYVSKLDPHGGLTCLDVAGGTGDIAMRILDHARERYADRDTKVTMLDINPEMLEEGKKRFAKTMYHGSAFAFSLPLSLCTVNSLSPSPCTFFRSLSPFSSSFFHPPPPPLLLPPTPSAPQIDFLLGNAELLDGIPDNSIDLYTIAFGIRNVTNIPKALEAAHRVLKPGGVISVLEFSKVPNPVLSKCVAAFSPPLPDTSLRWSTMLTRRDAQGLRTLVLPSDPSSRSHPRGRPRLVPIPRRGASSRLLLLPFPFLPPPLPYPRPSFLCPSVPSSFLTFACVLPLLPLHSLTPHTLLQSIAKFPPQERFAQMIRDAGFTTPQEEEYENLTFGIAAIHTGVKV